MKKLSEVIIEKMKDSNSLTEDEEIVQYGLDIIIDKTIFIFVVIIVGFLSNCLLESIIFAITFAMLRQYAGGYHAETKRKCFLLSFLTIIAALCVIRFAEGYQMLMRALFIICLISSLYIFLTAPMETANKKFDEDEIRVYGRKARIITVIIITAVIILYLINFKKLACTAATSIVVEAYLMLKGFIQNCRNGVSL